MKLLIKVIGDVDCHRAPMAMEEGGGVATPIPAEPAEAYRRIVLHIEMEMRWVVSEL